MKKVLFSAALICAAAFGLKAQSIPSCTNDNALEGRITGIENSGWVEVNREFYYVAYDEPLFPENNNSQEPFLLGTLQVSFGRDCDPGEACTEELLLFTINAYYTNSNTCMWRQ